MSRLRMFKGDSGTCPVGGMGEGERGFFLMHRATHKRLYIDPHRLAGTSLAKYIQFIHDDRPYVLAKDMNDDLQVSWVRDEEGSTIVDEILGQANDFR